MIIRIATTQQTTPIGHIVLSDIQKGGKALRTMNVIDKPVGVVEKVVKSFWTVLSHDTE